MPKNIKKTRKIYTYSADEKVVKEFKKQSYELNKSVSERIEEFMKKENEK
jgi:predicted transcriptional regulator